MKKYLIYACEEMYHGLHGIEDMTIIETDDLAVANAIGQEMSRDLITSYGLESDYLDSAMEELGYDEEDFDADLDVNEKVWNLAEEMISENLSWQIFEIRKETNESTNTLLNKAFEDFKGFIEEYDCDDNI